MRGLFNKGQFNNRTFNTGIVEAVLNFFTGGGEARQRAAEHRRRIHQEDEEAIIAIIAHFTEAI